MISFCFDETVPPVEEKIDDGDIEELNEVHDDLQSIFDKTGSELDKEIKKEREEDRKRKTDISRSIRG